uniref:5'-3' exoribonuclease 1 n=1 Tax=Trichuris muris TaxID=70415 RepID=A0A5S6QVR1_TRIMR
MKSTGLVDILKDRYPCICQRTNDSEILFYDNLYLNLSRVMSSWHFRDTELRDVVDVESELLTKVSEFIEWIFALVKPTKVFFVATDGVSPVAKMNKQRARCFRLSKQAEYRSRDQQSCESFSCRFDLNCITPGSVFADKLHNHLKCYFEAKMNTDPVWRNVEVIYSGYDCPGDGEQKILCYIRYLRAQPTYNSSTKHCMYGLATDLIVLGLATHEPNFALLSGSSTPSGSEGTFIKSSTGSASKLDLLHFSLLRQYLSIEFAKLRLDYPLLFDFERCLDDWILLICLNGNDSVPRLKNVNAEALPQLWSMYMASFGKMQGHLSEEGRLNVQRLEVYFERLAEIDRLNFTETYDDLLWLRSKSAVQTEMTGVTALEQWCSDFWSACSLSANSKSSVLSRDHTEGWDRIMENEFLKYRINYYTANFNVEKVDASFMVELKVSYLQALQWTLKYYYDGVVSWNWFYPFHWSPFVTDLKCFQGEMFQFALGDPLLPFQYMLGVLPSKSFHLLPTAYQDLFDPSSPLAAFVPRESDAAWNEETEHPFADLNVPFIDVAILLEVTACRDHLLTDSERRRNRLGHCLVFQCPGEGQENYAKQKKADDFLDLYLCTPQLLPADVFDLSPDSVVHGLLPNAKVLFPSFNAFERSQVRPTIPPLITAGSHLKPIAVSAVAEEQEDMGKLACQLLGKWLLVKFPHCVPALCTAVSTAKERYDCLQDSGEMIGHCKHDLQSEQNWKRCGRRLQMELCDLKAVKLNEVRTIVHCTFPTAVRCSYKADGSPVVHFHFSNVQEQFPYDTTVKVIDGSQFFLQRFENTQELFTYGCILFSLVTETYGQKGFFLRRLDGDLLRIQLARSSCKIMQANLAHVAQRKRNSWLDVDQLMKKARMSSRTVARLVGNVWLLKNSDTGEGSINIGLNLKFSKANMHKPAYTVKTATGRWLYSTQTALILTEYKRRFPEVIEYLSHCSAVHKLDASVIWEDCRREQRLAELLSWLRCLPVSAVRTEQCGTKVVDIGMRGSLERMIRLERNRLISSGREEFYIVDMKASDLYCPSLVFGNWPLNMHKHYCLLDRVVCVRPCFAVPLGLAGTVIHVPPMVEVSHVDLLVLFDEEFVGAFRPDGCKLKSAYYVPIDALLNIRHVKVNPPKTIELVSRALQSTIYAQVNKQEQRMKS